MVQITTNTPYFKLAEHCKITTGQKTDLLVNLREGTYFDLDKKISQLFDAQGYIELNNDPVLHKIIQLLTTNNLGQPVQARTAPLAPTPFRSPFLVSNAIIQFGDAPSFTTALETLLELNCPFFEFRVTSNQQAHQVNQLINALTPRYYPFRYSVLFFMHEQPQPQLRKNIYFKFVEANAVENDPITPQNFVVNPTAYAEAQTHHMGLNGKVYINQHLDVFCHPTHTKPFGNLASKPLTQLLPAIANAYWHVPTHLIKPCNTCRFRHICCDFDELVTKNNQHLRKHPCNP